MQNIQDIMLAAAYIAKGASKAAGDRWLEHVWAQGHLELMQAAVRYAPLAVELVNPEAEATGVYEYEVCEEFGSWLVWHATPTGSLPDRCTANAKLLELATAFYRGDE